MNSHHTKWFTRDVEGRGKEAPDTTVVVMATKVGLLTFNSLGYWDWDFSPVIFGGHDMYIPTSILAASA